MNVAVLQLFGPLPQQRKRLAIREAFAMQYFI
jgi:hypothetical protein